MTRIGRVLEIVGLFCKRALQKRLYSAKETYDFKEPTDRSHPIPKTAPINIRNVKVHVNVHTNTVPPK